ncbi:hypothetical protein, partial [Streptobacillus felis]|uniref:hypothetical protein n=1 Tax=Streptobacillus felis TaxID=1384509 RepID=UPI000AE02729
DYGLKVGTSGVSARVGEYGLDLNLNVLEAIVKPNEFKDKQELALKDLESSYKGIRSSIENISKTTSDEETDIADEERRSLRELSNYHLNGEYIVRSLNEKSANTKEDRLSLVRDVDFKDLKVFDKITEENVELLPEDLKRRYYEARERGEELRVIVDQEKNVYTFGDMSELEFKKGLARELGIHTEGRIKKDGKLLGATAGNIYSEYVLNGSEEITNLEKDNLLDIPRD